MIVCGIDEAGRGALAGPVVAGAVIFCADAHLDVSVFQDSKKIYDAKRRKLFLLIQQHCDWSFGIVSAKKIDELGIKKATHEAMKSAILKLSKTPDELFVDGCDGFSFDIPSTDIIHGDDVIKEISAASIVAKVVRDDLMIQLHKLFPDFHFQENKGYGSRHHLSLLEQKIFCKEHRQTYDPLATFLRQGRLFL